MACKWLLAGGTAYGLVNLLVEVLRLEERSGHLLVTVMLLLGLEEEPALRDSERPSRGKHPCPNACTACG